VLVQGLTLGQLFSKRSRVALPAYRYRFRQALHRFVARPSPQKIPSGPLVLLADGLWFAFDGMPWVLYLTALKPCRGNYAIFLDPVLLPGKEGASRWQQAVAAIPPGATGRIQALVVDNLPGMRRLAHQHRWVLQLCHFHLLLKLQAQRRGVRYMLRGGPVREEIHRLIRRALDLPEGHRLSWTLERLRRLSHRDCGTLRIQTTVREFVQHLECYRSFLTNPSLGLPRTTNSVESMGRLLREMFRSSRYLDQLPVLSLQPGRQSGYGLRRAAHYGQLCTVEVAAELLRLVGDQTSGDWLDRYFRVFSLQVRVFL